ncbi:MAG: extracellular solute-binding protein [Pseudomonadota bacterium]|nr:extracellular solute-binding protein [Pseudomonadota bacterium]
MNFFITVLLIFSFNLVQASSLEYKHGIAMHGDLKYPEDFEKFDYASSNPNKGGQIKLSSIGTFDNLNPYILKGVAAWQTTYLFETLMKSSFDEPFSQYGLIAQGVKIPEDRSWVAFKLRNEAKFSDGTPITPEDVVFSFNILIEKGHPIYKTYYGQVDYVKKISESEIKFFFKGEPNPELPLIIGYQLPIFSKKYWENKEFDKTTLEPPLGSGPYLVSEVKPGRSITFKKNPNYWGKDLNVNSGRFNFETIHTDYYRDETVALEAFKSGSYDFKLENSSKNWATAYNFKAVDKGQVLVEEIKYFRPSGMQGFAFNIRKNIFKNRNVRKALSYAFDFEWSNRNLFYGAYSRTKSFFDNSELSSQNLPDKKELRILENYRGKVPDEVFNTVFSPPNTEIEENGLRKNLRIARRILKNEGWVIKNGILKNNQTDEVLEFEILLRSPLFERIVLPMKRNLKKLGINVSVRTVQDDSQYIRRLENFDFDMVVTNYGSIISPGNEQKNYWSSQTADQPGSPNIIGVKNPVIDEIIEKLISSKSREELITHTRILDRILLFNYYLIPQFHIGHYRVAYWNKLSRPEISPKYDLGFDFWWYDPEKARLIGEIENEPTQKKKNNANYVFFLLASSLILIIWRIRRKN